MNSCPQTSFFSNAQFEPNITNSSLQVTKPPQSVISFSAGSYVDGHVAFCSRLEIGSWGLYLPRISDRPLYGFLLEICLPPPWLQRHVLQTCFPRFVDRTSLAPWQFPFAIDQVPGLLINCDKGQFAQRSRYSTSCTCLDEGHKNAFPVSGRSWRAL